MSNPTSNFGWQMPEPTDLVTDLPADFEVFGQAVDTDFVDLLGGTTGQILSKTSATDLDFTWVSPNAGDITGVTAGTGISGGGTSGTVTVTNDMATTITAAGDIVVGTGSGTYDNLPIGSTNDVLTADTTVSPYKVKWAAPAGGGKVLQVLQDTQVGIVQSTSTSFATTNLSQAITPSSASSKVLVEITINGLTKTAGDGDTAVDLRLLRGATVLASFGDRCAFTNASGTNVIAAALTYLDSPSTTSATTYSVEFRSKVSGQLVYVNNYSSNGDTTFSSITTSEIGA